jgi:hypothetical protein
MDEENIELLDLEPVIENIPYQKVAIAIKDYEEYDIYAGDAIGLATYHPVWDEDPTAWNILIGNIKIYSVIDHEWKVWKDENNLPEIKTIDI